MLGDSEIESLDKQLDSIVENSRRYHEDLNSLFEKFQDLLESYNQLKSDYEEEKEAREKYKKLAKGLDRNPFVLVLIDGDGYIFKERLIRGGADGGINAARLLSDFIREQLHSSSVHQAEQCRVVVRIYANVLGLSKSLARAGLIGHEARSLSPFASSFTRSQDLFDFIDAGDKKEGADYKIRELFRLFADNSQCKHIFFGGCHDTGYLSLLTPYRGNIERITLLKAASFHPEYGTLNLPVKEVPSVFMSTLLVGVDPPSGFQSANATSQQTLAICKHFQKGICKFGNECMKAHIMPNQQLDARAGSAADESHHSHFRTRLSPGIAGSRLAAEDLRHYSTMLPPVGGKADDLIPVNGEGSRIDTYLPDPPADCWEAFQRRTKHKKLCNKHHLARRCRDVNCEFDHTDVNPAELSVVKYILRQHPCSKGSRCRSIKCYTGHICQKNGCKGIRPCRFKWAAHTLDLHIAQWELPIDSEGFDPDDVFQAEETDAANETGPKPDLDAEEDASVFSDESIETQAHDLRTSRGADLITLLMERGFRV